MPNRILRDWTDSETIDKISVQAERFLIRLIMKVDDYGRFTANVKMLKSLLFPLRTDIRETDITRCLAECQESGLIVLYSVASKEYVQIENFKQKLRQKIEKYPSPDHCIADAMQAHSNGVPETKPETRNQKPEVEGEISGDKSPTIKSFKKFSEKDFIDEIGQFSEFFEKEMLNKFFKYWKELSPGGKMRFQLEKTWETKLRLEKWKSNQEKFNQNGSKKHVNNPGKVFVADEL